MTHFTRVLNDANVNLILNLIFIYCLEAQDQEISYYAFCNQTYHICYYSNGQPSLLKLRQEASAICRVPNEKGRLLDMEDEYSKMDILTEFMSNYSVHNTLLNAAKFKGNWAWGVNKTVIKMDPKFVAENDSLYLRLSPETKTHYVVCLIECQPRWFAITKKSFGMKGVIAIDEPVDLMACKVHCIFVEPCLAVEWRDKCYIYTGQNLIYIPSANSSMHKISRFRMSITACLGDVDLKYYPATIPSTTTLVETTTTKIVATIETPVKDDTDDDKDTKNEGGKENSNDVDAGKQIHSTKHSDQKIAPKPGAATRPEAIEGPPATTLTSLQSYLVPGLVILGVVLLGFKMLKKHETSSSEEE